MPEIGGAQLLAAGSLATTGAAVDLTMVAMWADEELPPTLRGDALFKNVVVPRQTFISI